MLMPELIITPVFKKFIDIYMFLILFLVKREQTLTTVSLQSKFPKMSRSTLLSFRRHVTDRHSRWLSPRKMCQHFRRDLSQASPLLTKNITNDEVDFYKTTGAYVQNYHCFV